MAAERESSTITDWVVLALSPILIMLMVGSLTFFLVEVFYAGQYSSRLLYTMFFFVIGAVLIARISIQFGTNRAMIYSLGLGLATLFALMSFVEYPTAATRALSPIINIVLMLIVWWSANRLTWDCTHLDEDRKTSGRGVLAAAGLDDSLARNPADQRVRELQGETEASDEEFDRAEKKKRKKDPDGVMGWFARWNRYRDAQRQKPHTPGTWIVYFSLAAFPIFGLGQSLIPVDDTARRQSTFYQMAVYMGSGLMLLVSTSLLGLRKYLRERNAKIPARMTAGWLGLGVGIVLLFVLIAAVLPRPHSETPLINLPKAGKQDRKASKYAQKTDDGAARKGQGQAGQKQEAGRDAKASGKNGEKGGQAGEKGNGGGKGKDAGGKHQGDDKGQQQGKNGQPGDEQKKNEQQQNGPNAKNDKQGEQKNPDGGEDAQQADGQANEEDRSTNDSDSSPSKLTQALESISGLLKWITWIVIAVLVVGGLAIFFLKYLSSFTVWAKNLLDWLRSLFAPKARQPRGGSFDENEPEAKTIERPPPFSEFVNPFSNGSARKMTLQTLIAYSFQAFEAWAWDDGLGRTPDETPYEFAARISEHCEELDTIGRQLANLYVQSLYSNSDQEPVAALKILKEFWQTIESAELVHP